MPLESGLTARMWVGFYGKHPGFGDFIAKGIPGPARTRLEQWLPATLTELRTRLGIAWSGHYDAARPIRFWLGADVAGLDAPVCGALMASRDAVGRRFPLLACQSAPSPAPPPAFVDQGAFDRLEHWACAQFAPAQNAEQPPDLSHLHDALMAGQGVAEPRIAPEFDDSDTLWAVNPTGDLQAVLGAAMMADYARAARARSYWWCGADDSRASALWSCTGLPGAQAFGWLLSGVSSNGAIAPEFADNTCETPFTPAPEAVEKPAAEDDAL